MIGILIGIIVTIVLIIFCTRWRKGGDPISKLRFVDFLFSLFLGVVCFVFIDMLALIPYSRIALDTTQTTEIVATEEIVALHDNSEIAGNFYLGCGSVNNTNYYAFYLDTENGYKYETLNAESSYYPVYIKYTSSDTETPHIDRYSLVERTALTSETNPIWFSVIAYLAYGGYNSGDVIKEKICSPAAISSTDGYYDNFRYEIFIPKGSILNDYSIDLE